MHAVIRQYTASPAVAEQARPMLDDLKQTVQQTPGFVAYSFLETDEGIATVTVTEDERGTAESMTRAAQWVREHLPNSGLGAPRVTSGSVTINGALPARHDDAFRIRHALKHPP